METEFQVLKQWVRRILRSVLEGQGFPEENLSSLQLSKYNSKNISDTILALINETKLSKEEERIKEIPSPLKGLFNKVDHHNNKEHYYAILYFFLLRRFYEQEANEIMGYLSKKSTRMHPVAELQQQVIKSFDKTMKKVAKTDMLLLEKVKQLKTTVMEEMNAQLEKVLDRDQIIDEIDTTFPFRPEDISARKERIIGLAEELSLKPISYRRPPHRPRGYILDPLIILMNLYFETLGHTNYKKHGLIAQTVNYCFPPKQPLDRDKVRLRLSDQWKKKIEKIERKA